MKLRTLALLALGSALSLAAHGLTPVHIECTNLNSDDYIGLRFCSALRDRVATSPRYYDETDAYNDKTWVIHVLTVGIGYGDRQIGSAVSAVMVREADHPTNVTQLLITVPAEQVSEAAASLWANIDRDIQK